MGGANPTKGLIGVGGFPSGFYLQVTLFDSNGCVLLNHCDVLNPGSRRACFSTASMWKLIGDTGDPTAQPCFCL